MKKILLAAAALVTALGASAQSYLLNNPSNHPYLGVRASYNLSLPGKINSEAGSVTTKHEVFGKGSGVTVGAIYNLPLVANMYLEPGVTFGYTTESLKGVSDMFKNFKGLDMKHNSARKFSFEIPVQVGYHFDFTPDISLAVSTGPVLKVGIVNDYYLTAETPSGNEIHQSGSLYGSSEALHRVDCAWRVGVGFNINQHYYVGVNGDLGMANMLNDSNEGTQSLHENSFQVTLGYNF